MERQEVIEAVVEWFDADQGTERWNVATQRLMDLGVGGQQAYEIVTWLWETGRLILLCEKHAAELA
jgi:hypothetical protein